METRAEKQGPETRNSAASTSRGSNKRKRSTTTPSNASNAARKTRQQISNERTRDKDMCDIFATKTLEPTELIPAYTHVGWPGNDWGNEAAPPPGHISRVRGGRGAWRCKRQHACGGYYNSSKRLTCAGCGGERNFDNEMDWDIKYDGRGSGYKLFHKDTGFVPTLSNDSSANSRKYGHHRNAKSCRMRIFLCRAFPEHLSEDLRPYWSRHFE
jgi:hypothetical protein